MNEERLRHLILLALNYYEVDLERQEQILKNILLQLHQQISEKKDGNP